MNWVGGARNRLKFQGDRRVQKEFFDKKKLDLKCEKLQRPGVCHSSTKNRHRISQDLVALQTVSNASLKASGNPLQNVKQVDLVRRPAHLAGKLGSRMAAGKHSVMRPVTAVELPYSPELAPSKLQFQVPEKPRCVQGSYTWVTALQQTDSQPRPFDSQRTLLAMLIALSTGIPGNQRTVHVPKNTRPSNVSLDRLVSKKTAEENERPLTKAPVSSTTCSRNLPAQKGDSSNISKLHHSTFAQAVADSRDARNTFSPLQGISAQSDRHYHDKLSQMKNLWISEDFQVSPLILPDADAALMTPYLSTSPRNPFSRTVPSTQMSGRYSGSEWVKSGSAKRKTSTESHNSERMIPPVPSRFSSPETPSPNLWKKKRHDLSEKDQCFSSSRIHDMTAPSFTLHKPWSLSDSEITSERAIKVDDGKLTRESGFGKCSLWRSPSESMRKVYGDHRGAEEYLTVKKRKDTPRTVTASQQTLVPERGRRFEWDSVFLSHPASAATSFGQQCLQQDEEDSGPIGLGKYVPSSRHKTPVSVTKSSWIKKETQIAEVLQELNQLEEQTHSIEQQPARQTADFLSCKMEPSATPKSTFSDKGPSSMESDTDVVVQGVVEELVHNTVLHQNNSAQQIGHSSFNQPFPEVQIAEEADHCRSTDQPHQQLALQDSKGNCAELRSKETQTGVAVSTMAIQTDLTLTDMEALGKFQQRKTMLDIGTQWEAPSFEQNCDHQPDVCAAKTDTLNQGVSFSSQSENQDTHVKVSQGENTEDENIEGSLMHISTGDVVNEEQKIQENHKHTNTGYPQLNIATSTIVSESTEETCARPVQSGCLSQGCVSSATRKSRTNEETRLTSVMSESEQILLGKIGAVNILLVTGDGDGSVPPGPGSLTHLALLHSPLDIVAEDGGPTSNEDRQMTHGNEEVPMASVDSKMPHSVKEREIQGV